MSQVFKDELLWEKFLRKVWSLSVFSQTQPCPGCKQTCLRKTVTTLLSFPCFPGCCHMLLTRDFVSRDCSSHTIIVLFDVLKPSSESPHPGIFLTRDGKWCLAVQYAELVPLYECAGGSPKQWPCPSIFVWSLCLEGLVSRQGIFPEHRLANYKKSSQEWKQKTSLCLSWERNEMLKTW